MRSQSLPRIPTLCGSAQRLATVLRQGLAFRRTRKSKARRSHQVGNLVYLSNGRYLSSARRRNASSSASGEAAPRHIDDRLKPGGNTDGTIELRAGDVVSPRDTPAHEGGRRAHRKSATPQPRANKGPTRCFSRRGRMRLPRVRYRRKPRRSSSMLSLPLVPAGNRHGVCTERDDRGGSGH